MTYLNQLRAPVIDHNDLARGNRAGGVLKLRCYELRGRQLELPVYGSGRSYLVSFIEDHLPEQVVLDERDKTLLQTIELAETAPESFVRIDSTDYIFGAIAGLFLPSSKPTAAQPTSSKNIWQFCSQHSIVPTGLEIKLLDRGHHRLVYRIGIKHDDYKKTDLVVSIHKGALPGQSLSEWSNLTAYWRLTSTIPVPYSLGAIVNPQRIVLIREYLKGERLEELLGRQTVNKFALAVALGQMFGDFFRVTGRLPDHITPHNVIVAEADGEYTARMSEVACVVPGEARWILDYFSRVLGKQLKDQGPAFFEAFRQNVGGQAIKQIEAATKGTIFASGNYQLKQLKLI